MSALARYALILSGVGAVCGAALLWLGVPLGWLFVGANVTALVFLAVDQ